MTQLDRLADIVSSMAFAPWRPDIDSSLRHGSAWAVGPERVDSRGALNDAIGIAALRNVADALIAVARAAKATKIRCRCTDYKSCEECVLVNARDALDAAIVRALGEGT